MNAEQHRAKSIFLNAAEIAARADQEAYVAAQCGNDEALRREVVELLAHHAPARAFLEAPAAKLAATREEPAGERPGTVIGPYKLLQQIGEGGMGTVFMAEQEHPVRRKVALKVIKAGMDSRQVIARFEAERQALAMMDHVNIARVLDAGTIGANPVVERPVGERSPDRSPSEPWHGQETVPQRLGYGRPYFVMELVHGVPITKYCDDNRLTPRQRLELFVPVCQAIQHAHQKGIIHRDVKPTNVMITLYDGKPVPKVIDFGVAKATEQRLTEQTLFTQYGTMVGTLEYMSPEQAEMSALGVDTRSDIYSLGVLLYELLTGGTPLTHKRMKEAAYGEILRMIKEDEPPKPSTRLSDSGEALASISAQRHMEPAKLSKLLRGELDWIVMKTLEKDRGRRYETAKDLAADVQRYLNDEPVQAFPPSAWYRLRKLVRRHKGPVLAASMLVVALVGGIIGTTWGMIRATDARADAVKEAGQKETALAAARQSEREKTAQLSQALVAQARANRLSRRPGQRFESLESLQQAMQLARTLKLPSEKFDELRNAVTATLALPDLYLAGPWNAWPADGCGLDFDEAHAIYARTDRQGNCSIRRVADDAEIHRLPGLGGPAAPRLSRDGTFVAIQHWDSDCKVNVAVHVWQLDGSTPRRLLAEERARVPAFRDSQQLALAYADGAIRVFELPGGRQLSRLAPDTLTREVGIALHPTEPLVAVCSYFGPVVQVRDVNTQKVLKSLPQSDRVSSVSWHPDGRTLAVGYAESCQIRLYDRTTWQVYRTLTTGQAVTSIEFDHAGDWLAIYGWSSMVELFDVGTGQKLMTSPPLVTAAHRFSRDGRRLAGASQDGKVGIWRIAGQEYRTLVRRALPENGQYTKASVSPDGRLLAGALTEGFGLWDLASGGELAFIPSYSDSNRVLFERSGDLLTLSAAGLARWPIAKELNAAGEWVIGPPERLPLPHGHDLGQSRDGRVIVTCDRAVGPQQAHAGGWILHTDRPGEPIRLDAGADIAWIAVSPDGRWVITVTQAVGLAKIWDARDGRLVRQLADWKSDVPRFSPDGRWLATDFDGGRLFAVGTWEPGPRVGGGAVFAPDSKLLAVPILSGFRLVDHATGREVAMLEAPNLDLTYQAVFSPDGAKLLALNNAKGIRVWDLRLIRRHLKEIGLDWDWPEFPPAPQSNDSRAPLTITVDSGPLKQGEN